PLVDLPIVLHKEAVLLHPQVKRTSKGPASLSKPSAERADEHVSDGVPCSSLRWTSVSKADRALFKSGASAADRVEIAETDFGSGLQHLIAFYDRERIGEVRIGALCSEQAAVSEEFDSGVPVEPNARTSGGLVAAEIYIRNPHVLSPSGTDAASAEYAAVVDPDVQLGEAKAKLIQQCRAECM